ncbi:helix-turn-helix domain-containing protein [Nocardia amamiensis]|uniref:helix-turn-helix domain-containing protein n=1 Tax=Nocardia amamiensis TaxID=404578 RepID=UPI000836D5E9|nr:helix-turn-helix transcriptional regulator [Nocardia amamiensis]
MTTWWTGETVLALRNALRLSQREFALLVGCSQKSVSNWERGESRVSADGQLALDEVLATLEPVARGRFAVLAEETDVDRRQFLMTTAALAATAGASKPEVTPAAIDHLRTTVHAGMLLDDSLGSDAAKPLIDQLARTCVRLLPDCPELLEPQLSRLAAEAIGSSAWAAWDQRDVKLADALFQQAFRYAEAAGDTDVQAGILVHRTDLAVWMKRYAAAADFADAALRIRVRDRRMADYRALRAAQAYAHANRRQDARRQLDRVSNEHLTETTPDESYAYWMAAWVTGDITGSVLEATGDRRSAAESVEQSLQFIPVHAARHQALTLLRLARLTAPDDLDRAVGAAKEAVALSRKNTSPRLRGKYLETRKLLAPWSNARVVRDLDVFAAGVI